MKSHANRMAIVCRSNDAVGIQKGIRSILIAIIFIPIIIFLFFSMLLRLLHPISRLSLFTSFVPDLKGNAIPVIFTKLAFFFFFFFLYFKMFDFCSVGQCDAVKNLFFVLSWIYCPRLVARPMCERFARDRSFNSTETPPNER